MMTGLLALVAASMVRVIFSPTTDPMVAARKEKSITANPILCPPTRADPEITASVRPVF